MGHNAVKDKKNGVYVKNVSRESMRREGKALIVVVLSGAFWPVWKWFYLNLSDPSGEVWSVLPLLTAVVFLFTTASEKNGAPESLWLPAGLCVLYCCLFHSAAPLVRAVIAMLTVSTTFGSVFLKTKIHTALTGLLLLSLPVISTLQFYAGYPLRVVSGAIAVFLLQLSGFPVILEGTVLNLNGLLVSIDVPCSGVKMMWAAVYLSLTLSCFLRFSALKTVAIVLCTMPVILFGNAIRATGLFFTESGILHLPPWSHNAIGMIVFFMVMLAIVCVANFMNKEAVCEA